MQITRVLQLIAVSAAMVAACPELQILERRQQERNVTGVPIARYWAYEQSYDWGRQNPDWELCQTGTQQSPIPLRVDQGLSRNHQMTFNYPNDSVGSTLNWGYGPSCSLDHPEDVWTDLPSMTFEDNNSSERVYLAGWHIHAPADHTVQGDRSKAELHFVHTNTEGKERVVLAFRIDPGNSESKFFKQLPKMIHFNESSEVRTPDVHMNLNDALNEVNNFNDFWTYKGSLTSPPCTEGKRWFVARNILYVSDTQMQDILRVSTYSARAEQEVWGHEINL